MRISRKIALTTCVIAGGGTLILWLCSFKPITPDTSKQNPANKEEHVLAPVESKTAPSPEPPAGLMHEPAPSPAASPISAGDLLADSSLSAQGLLNALAGIVKDDKRTMEDRTEALAHLLNLSVEDPSPTLLPLLEDPHLPASLALRIFQDALNAPLSWQATACLAILGRTKDKSLRDEVQTHLGFLTGQDHGNNLAEWTKAVAAAGLSRDKAK